MAFELKKCVVCGESDLLLVIDLDKQPLANGFHEPADCPASFPLALNKCMSCHHCQLSHAVDPVALFTKYLYVSGTSQTALTYFKDFAEMVTRKKNGANKIDANITDAKETKDTKNSSSNEQEEILQETKRSTGCILEIACNDGSQLDAFAALGWETHGVDPAENIVTSALEKGHKVVTAFWDSTVAKQFVENQFDVIVAQNVLAHTAEPTSFLSAILPLCGLNTDVYVQTSQIDMIFNGEFDTIYHEHISFFSVRSMQKLAERCGFRVEEVQKVRLHGGSALFRLRKAACTSVKEALEYEERMGLTDHSIALKFSKTVNHSIRLLRQLVAKAQSEKYGVVGFGAAAKSMTVLCTAGVALDYIVDDNPLKQNLLSPGMNIPITPSSRLENDTRPLMIIILAWNFGPEIVNKIRALRPPQPNRPGDKIVYKYIFGMDDRIEDIPKDL